MGTMVSTFKAFKINQLYGLNHKRVRSVLRVGECFHCTPSLPLKYHAAKIVQTERNAK